MGNLFRPPIFCQWRYGALKWDPTQGPAAIDRATPSTDDPHIIYLTISETHGYERRDDRQLSRRA